MEVNLARRCSLSLAATANFHAIIGALAISAGFLAFLSRKGSGVHRVAGNIFVFSMLGSAATGVWLGLAAPVMLSAIGGAQVIYLVSTSWVTIKRSENRSGVFEIIACMATLLIAGIGFAFGLEAARSEDGLKDGFPAILYFIYGTAIGIACAVADLTVILRGGISGSQRLARHLWRMGFAMYVATASFFLGQPQVFPEAIRGTLILASPVLLVIALTMFWAIWVHVKVRRHSSVPQSD